MKTLKEIEEDFKSEFFTTAAAMGTYGVDELGNRIPCHPSLSALK